MAQLSSAVAVGMVCMLSTFPSTTREVTPYFAFTVVFCSSEVWQRHSAQSACLLTTLQSAAELAASEEFN